MPEVNITGTGGTINRTDYVVEFGGDITDYENLEAGERPRGDRFSGIVGSGVDTLVGPYPVVVTNLAGGTIFGSTPDVIVEIDGEQTTISGGETAEFTGEDGGGTGDFIEYGGGTPYVESSDLDARIEDGEVYVTATVTNPNEVSSYEVGFSTTATVGNNIVWDEDSVESFYLGPENTRTAELALGEKDVNPGDELFLCVQVDIIGGGGGGL